MADEEDKPKYPSRKKPPRKKKIYQDPVEAKFIAERALRQEFFDKFRGRAGRMLNAFMQEAVKMQRRIVFDIDDGDSPEPPEDPWEGMFVFKLDKDTGKVLGAYRSLRHAAQENPTVNYRGIGYACQGKIKESGGFKWRWRQPGPQRAPKKSPFND